MYIKYQVAPKTIDDKGNENPLPDFVVTTAFTESNGSNVLAVPFADKYVLLATPDILRSFELQSDQPINLAFFLNGVLQIELPNVYNHIVKSDGLDFLIYVRNLSGVTANILWRAYK